MTEEKTTMETDASPEGKRLDQVSGEEVAAFLEESGFRVSGQAGAEAEEPEQRPPAGVPTDSRFSPDNPTRDALLEWTLSAAAMQGVELSLHEKQEFLRSVLHDKDVVMDIEVLGGHRVTCRSLGEAELELMFAALRKAAAGEGWSEAEYFSAMQAMGVLMQVVAVDGKVLECFRKKHGEDGKAAGDRLLRATRELVSTIRSPRMAMLRNALRVFSVKMKLCTDNMLNSDFWNPVDAG